MPFATIVIINWNNASYLHRCIQSLRAQTYTDFEVIIIDNGSTDNSILSIEEGNLNFDLRLVKLESNQGFAAANNIGARLASGKWLALLNTDAFPEPDWLEKLLQATERNPEFSCFSSRQIQANSPDFLDGAGDAYHVSGLAWRVGLGYPSEKYGLNSSELFSPCAAAAMYLREAFLDVDGFDEDFFSYFEDVDLGFRLQLKGYRCIYVPDAIVHHVGSATFGERSDFAFYHAHRNLIWTFIKNMPATMLWRYLSAHVIANAIYVIYYTLHGRGKVLWRAKWDAIKKLSKFLIKRREIQKKVQIKTSDLERVMEHGWLQPYLLGYHMRKARLEAGFPPDKN